jgi:hypothetical protein
MTNIIYKIAFQKSWGGPLANAFKKQYPKSELNQWDFVVAAEFHDSNMEPSMPPKVREAFVDRAQKLRAARLQPQKNKKKRWKKNRSVSIKNPIS